MSLGPSQRQRYGSLIVLLLMVAGSAHAYRREYRVTLEGKRKRGAEVCFYRGDPKPADAFALFFYDAQARCLPADNVLDFPPGLFHAYARHRDGYVSAYRDYFVYSDPPNPEGGYELLEIPLKRSASVAFAMTLKAGQSVGVWIAQTPTTDGTFFPLVPGEKSIQVPADTPFLPLLIEDHRPIALGEFQELGADEQTTISEFLAKKDKADVVVWTKLDRDAARAAAAIGPAPDVTVVQNGERRAPFFPLYSANQATFTFLFFPDVAHGPAQLRLQGRTWATVLRDIDVRGHAHVEREPLVLRPAAALTARWPVPDDQVRAACPKEKRVDQPAVVVALYRCATDASPTPCTPIARRTTRYGGEAVTWTGLPGGTYEVRATPTNGPTASAGVVLKPGTESQLAIPVETFNFFGRVTVNGQPFAARLSFETGEAQSDAAGMYNAQLLGDPGKNLVHVDICNQPRTLTHVPQERVARNGAFDIALQATSYRVSVVDDRRKPVSGARVKFSPLRNPKESDTDIFYSSPEISTNAAGEAMFDDAPADKTLLFCATHTEYSSTCAPPVAPGKEQVVIRVQRPTLRGKILGHDGIGLLAYVDGMGRITEQVTLQPDGAFAFKQQHAPTEYLVYTAAARPLAVLSAPAGDGTHAVEIPLPASPARSFSVSVDQMPGNAGFIGLWVGGRYIPLQILASHQEMRGRDVQVYPNAALAISDIQENGPIEIAFAPEPVVMSAAGFTDVFTLPQYRSAQRYLVTKPDMRIPASR